MSIEHTEPDNIVWSTVSVRLGDLVEWEDNPVQLTKHDAVEIEKSLRKFGMVIPLVANAPLEDGKRRLIDGHQRKTILLYSRMADTEAQFDVRIPSRKLTDRECDELSIRLRKNTGDFDYDMLANRFVVPDLLDWGFQDFELGFANREPPSLDELAEQYGEPEERDFWPIIRVQVSPDTEAKYKALMSVLPGEDEAEKFESLVKSVQWP